MVTWDDTWTFTINYKKTIKKTKGQIVLVSVRDKETGIAWNVSRNGTINVSHGDIEIIVTVKNVGDTKGLVKVQCNIDGEMIGFRDVELKVGETTTVTFSKTLSQGTHKVEILTRGYTYEV